MIDLTGIISAGQVESASSVLVGNISADQRLVGSISNSQKLKGSIAVGDGILLPKYEGEMEVTPSAFNDKILKTAGTYMDSDIKVNKISYAEVSNTKGGKTVTIGIED